MNSSALSAYELKLAGLHRKSRLRALAPRQGIDFTSNDYLGLADAPRLKAAITDAIESGVPVGAGGSRLLRGNHPEHEALETEAAVFFGAERAIYFGSGFAANVALFSALPLRDDLVLYDALIHASVHDGIAAGKAKAVAVPHNQVEAFEREINRWRQAGGKGRPWIAVESLYSMDGDRAPVAALADLAGRHGGFLVVDEAHATGVFGPGGRGLAAELEGRGNVVALHTCGKALGLSGALISLPAVLADYLTNRARGFIYSTAPSPLMPAAVREALRIVADEPWRRIRLEELINLASEQLRSRLGVTPGGSQILPVMIGDNARALKIATRMRDGGFDVRAIRPPTVPEGTARLRISITLNVEESQIADMVGLLAFAMEEER
ncbi:MULTISPECIES: 8-amino-7-oxononanoate synthase [Rhizobium/Agrobacterium group]|uniref:8-amino-7-oxononanoate synthase n=1 Tax=Rhizobium/Agrobacterium group TaxID=227290 RepID=UPI00023A35EA|nr:MULTISPECIES: 8-amino-7-oxononanoate synthase [Rhizobium/Agrobacterium group]AHK03797.1 8-amino-7-oxononanoate synthase [Agrobacterium tumefaciens LBA4213 (Ach5)]AKC09557.1 8-amino-7-oxononanoate synthase [Agrobacterium tumefaciens]EHJ95921.1 8-amino-7-oxononanoate synthase [Agrobacterium tumefaciens 5A]AYM18701.1 8-amino-7-oxononanoate synthase [Agrobacterium tumefaciens]AYM70000.1 8-amino-7-oxononanoate synthase [Agrobacterium tumefaciens]